MVYTVYFTVPFKSSYLVIFWFYLEFLQYYMVVYVYVSLHGNLDKLVLNLQLDLFYTLSLSRWEISDDEHEWNFSLLFRIFFKIKFTDFTYIYPYLLRHCCLASWFLSYALTVIFLVEPSKRLFLFLETSSEIRVYDKILFNSSVCSLDFT